MSADINLGACVGLCFNDDFGERRVGALDAPHGLPRQQISEFSPDTMIIKTEKSSEPVRYTYTKSTTYVDESGAPVSIETVKSGLPVTVYYTQDGDRMVASKVIVRRAAVVAPAAPLIEEKKTTTTTTTDK